MSIFRLNLSPFYSARLATVQLLILLMIATSCNSNKSTIKPGQKGRIQGFAVSLDKDNQSAVVTLNTQPVLTFHFDTSKHVVPFINGLVNVSSESMLRGYPIKPRYGERADFAEECGWWSGSAGIKGSPFWPLPDSISGGRPTSKIVVKDIKAIKESKSKATFVYTAVWKNLSNQVIINEVTEVSISQSGGLRWVDRTTKLTSVAPKLELSAIDVDKGFTALRLARCFEMPVASPAPHVGPGGSLLPAEPNTNGATGFFMNAAGQGAMQIIGQPSPYVIAYGLLAGDNEVSLALIEHNKSFGYPSTWLARPAGYLAINPFEKAHINGGMYFENKVPKVFKYRLLMADGFKLTRYEVEENANEFNKSK